MSPDVDWCLRQRQLVEHFLLLGHRVSTVVPPGVAYAPAGFDKSFAASLGRSVDVL